MAARIGNEGGGRITDPPPETFYRVKVLRRGGGDSVMVNLSPGETSSYADVSGGRLFRGALL